MINRDYIFKCICEDLGIVTDELEQKAMVDLAYELGKRQCHDQYENRKDYWLGRITELDDAGEKNV